MFETWFQHFLYQKRWVFPTFGIPSHCWRQSHTDGCWSNRHFRWVIPPLLLTTTYGYESKPWYLVNPKIAGKWMFIPLKMVFS